MHINIDLSNKFSTNGHFVKIRQGYFFIALMEKIVINKK